MKSLQVQLARIFRIEAGQDSIRSPHRLNGQAPRHLRRGEPIVYPLALSMAALHAEAAKRLLEHLRSAEVRARFDRAGHK